MKKELVSVSVILLFFLPIVLAQETLDPWQCGVLSYRGDVNGDQVIDLSDPLALLIYLFLGGTLVCNHNSDINWDGKTDLSDAVYLLKFLFQGGEEPSQVDHGPIDDPIELAFYFKPLIGGSEVVQKEVGGILEVEGTPPLVLVITDLGGDDDIQECSGDIVAVDLNNQPIGNKESIFQSAWKKNPSFKGNNLLRYPLEISLEKVPSERSQIMFSCSDGESFSSISFILKSRSLKNLRFDDDKYEVEFLQVPNPVLSGPTACCEITCDASGAEIKTCEQTLSDDCQQTFGCWTDWTHGQGFGKSRYPPYDNPDDLCNKVPKGKDAAGIDIPLGGTCKKIEYHTDNKACNKDVSPPVCAGDCKVDKMTIFRGGDMLPSDVYVAPEFTVQTVGTELSLGHLEGWKTITKSLTGAALPTPENVYEIGYRFLPYAKVTGDPSTCYAGQFIKSTLVRRIRFVGGVFSEPQQGDALGIELIKFFEGDRIPNLMFGKNELVEEKKLSELPLLDYDPPTKIYEHREVEQDRDETGLKSKGACIYNGDIFCGDDYIKPPMVLKLASGSQGKIAWHDLPGTMTPLNKIMNVGPLSGGFPSTSGRIFLSNFDELMYSFISIIEDSDERARYVCYLSFHLANKVTGVTSAPKAVLLDHKCYCEQQQRVSGKWQTVSGKDNLPCGTAGLE